MLGIKHKLFNITKQQPYGAFFKQLKQTKMKIKDFITGLILITGIAFMFILDLI